MRVTTKRFLFTIAYGLIVVLFVEVALQLFYFVSAGQPLFTRVGIPIYVPNEYTKFGVRPNLTLEHDTTEFKTTIYTNSRGFRVSGSREEYTTGRDPSRYRIMILGPSFAFAWGVDFEDSFAARLEQLLEAGGYAQGRDVEIVNAGIPSSPPELQLAGYEHEWAEYAPDLVINFIYGSMVIAKEDLDQYSVDARGYLVRSLTFGRKMQLVLKKSAIVFYSWVIYTRLQSAGAETEPRTAVLGAGRELALQDSFRPDDPPVVESLRFYERLRRAVEPTGAELLILYFPLSYSVHRGDISRWRHLGVHDVDKQIAFDDAFCDYLSERGYECLDITPQLTAQSTSGDDRLYYWLDIHWTPRGNRVAAEAVAEFLLSERASGASGDASPARGGS